jgi:Carboxypeptidase regulatory-like domain/TonB-dependent Receptor Plug Domain
MRKTKVRWLIASMFALVPIIVQAQDTASLTGAIRDPSGAVVSRAGITVKNTANGLVRQLKTNSSGEYLAAGLPPGQYDVSVTAPGFRRYQAKNVTLRVAQNARVDLTLQVGSVTSEITVQGEGLTQVNTESSELAGTITGKELTQLLLNGRNFTQLVTLVPGVSNQTGQDEGVVGAQGSIAYSFNGGRTEYNNWEVDGGDNLDNGSNFSLNVYPSVEAIQEVQVLTSNYGAQYGRNGSGTVEVETKSGTNQFHGSIYEFARNELFNAHNYFDVPGSPKAGYKKHDFGYSLGGPIWKNHTFFFWSEEWRREVVPFNFFRPVPSLDNRRGNFNDQCNIPSPTDCPFDPNTGLPFRNNQLPSIDPNALALLPMIPAPNFGSGANSVFAAAIPQPTHWREELVRIDHDINSKMRATFRAIHDSWDTTNAEVTWGNTNFPTIGTHFIGPGVGLVARLTATVSPTLLNEFVASYTTDHINQINTNPSVWTRSPGFTMTGLFPNFQGKLPDFCLNTLGAYGGGFCEGPTAFPWKNSNPTYTLRDNLSKSLGRHKLEIGGYYVDAEKNELAFTDLEGDLVFDSTVPVSAGNAFADMLMGNIANYSQSNAQPKYHFNYKIFEPYIQDDFHVAKNLTLNLGFRLSLFGTFWEKHHLVGNWDPAAYNPKAAPLIDADGSVTGQVGALIPTPGTNPYEGIVQCGVGGTPRGCLKGHLFNPAPRVGFAWDPLGTGRMSIRAAYGIFFEHTNGMEVNAENEENTPPAVVTPTQYNIMGYTKIGGQGLLFPQSEVSIPDHEQWPYVQQWHLDVQRDLFRNAVATLSYVGSKGTHLTLQHELNQLRPTPASKNPFLPGQPITQDICNTQGGTATAPTFVVNGSIVAGKPAINLAVACGNDPDPFRPFYGVGSVERFEPVANSNYNALQFSVRKTSGALTLNVAYTYSHSLDDSSDNVDANFVNSYDVHKNYASSNYDERHILTVAWIYELPSVRGSRLTRALLSGWQYAGIMTSQSGTPFSVENGGFGDSAGAADGTVANGSFADIVGDPFDVPRKDPNQKGPLLFNPNAYIQPQGLTFGDSGRNSLNLLHRTNFDMAVYKVFKPTERVDVQFRAEGFNIFNHPQWNSLNAFVGTNNFLYPGGAHMPRVGQFAIRISF